MQSIKYNCIADWNSFHKTFKDIPLSECSCFKVTKLLMQRFLNKYILKLTILLCRSFGQISSIYFITCFVFVAWFYTLVLVLHILFHIVISTCFFCCNFLLLLVVVTITHIFRLCPNNILNALIMYNSSWLPNCVSLIFQL